LWGESCGSTGASSVFISLPLQMAFRLSLSEMPGEKVLYDSNTKTPPFLKPNQLKHMPFIQHRFRSARHQIRQTYRGVGLHYLQAYLDEYGFRANRDKDKQSMADSLFSYCMSVKSIPIKPAGTTESTSAANNPSKLYDQRPYITQLA